MVAATEQNVLPQNQQRQHHHLHHQQQKQQSLAASTTQPSSASPLSAQEEALKRNTDCVYFLASPLTCKKGSDCEYRHSDFARVNPRDCWFWLNGNCLNPKCGFRHPPLDGLLGAQAASVTGAPVPPTQKTRTPGTHASYGSKSVPCVFFQQGQCLKGDMCMFWHGPNPTTSRALQVQGTKQNYEPPKRTTALGSLEKCSQEKRFPQANVDKSVIGGSAAKTVQKVGTATKTNSSSSRIVPPPTIFNIDTSRSKATSISPTSNGIPVGQLNRPHQLHASDDHTLQNGKDSEEFLRESSPGFDVLVDDDLRASGDYDHDEDHFGREDNMDSVAEYDEHAADYTSVIDMHDHGRFHDTQGYASYGHIQEPYAWDQHRSSSERNKGVPDHMERRGYGKSVIPENKVSDLRYRLSKQRRVDGLRSVVSRDVPLDNQYDETSFRPSSRKDMGKQSLNDRSLSDRLRGRIKLPGRSSIIGDDRQERQLDRGRNERLSPERPQVSSYHGKPRDRMKGRGPIDYGEGKNFRVRQTRRDMMDAGSTDFAGPKSLAELKAVKITENKEQSLLGKRKFDDNHLSNDIYFKGPKPLSEILREKREAAAAASAENKEDSKIDEIGESKSSGSVCKAAIGTQSSLDSVGKEDSSKNAVEGEVDKTNSIHVQSSEGPAANVHEAEDGMIYDEMPQGQELEGVEQREGEYDDQVYEEDYAYDGDKHADEEEEYLDDEDGDDFAKKIGVMHS